MKTTQRKGCFEVIFDVEGQQKHLRKTPGIMRNAVKKVIVNKRKHYQSEKEEGKTWHTKVNPSGSKYIYTYISHL